MTGAVLCAALALVWTPAASAGERPIRVRLLSRLHPTAAAITAERLLCDGAPLAPAPTHPVRAVPPRVAVGERLCERLELRGAVRVVVKQERRELRGTVAVTAPDGELLLDAELPLEEYVAAVVGAEAPNLPPAAMAAQAVVVRSYALASKGRHGAAGYDVCDLTHCALYRGDGATSDASTAAARRTAGQVLRRDGALVQAFFHAACGGATSSARDVFGEDGPSGVADVGKDGRPLCARAEGVDWTWTVDASALARALDLPASSGELRIVRRDAAGRVMELVAFGKRHRGPDFLARVNRQLGHRSLRSLRFTVESGGGALRFVGRGVGHGVGFCQAGAAALADAGAEAGDLLRHYFPRAELTKR